MKNLPLLLLLLAGLTGCSKSNDNVDPNDHSGQYSAVSSTTFATAGSFDYIFQENTTFTITKTHDIDRLLFTDKTGYTTGGTSYATLAGYTFTFDRGSDSLDSTYFDIGSGSFSGNTITFKVRGYSPTTKISRDKIVIGVRHSN